MKYSYLLLFFLSFTINLFAGHYYWVGDSSTVWTDPYNWASSSGGTGGYGVPPNATYHSNIYVYIDSLSSNECHIDSLDIHVSNLNITGGVFKATNNKVIVSRTLTVTGGESTFSTLELSNRYTHTHKVDIDSIKVKGDFIVSNSSMVPSQDYWVKLGGIGSFNIEGDIYCTKTNVYALTTSMFTLNLVGDENQTIYGNSSLYGGARIPNLYINKPAGNVILKDNITIYGNLTYVNADSIITDSSLVYLTYGGTIEGNWKFNDLRIASYGGNGSSAWTTYSINSDIEVTGDLLFTEGSKYFTVNGIGKINLKGDINYKGRNRLTGGNLTIELNGNEDQKIVGDIVNITNKGLPKVTINKPAGTLFLKDTICVAGEWKYIQGEINTNLYESLICINKNGFNVIGNLSVDNLFINGHGHSTFTITDSSILSINGNLTYGGGVYYNRLNGPGKVHLKGNLNVVNNAPLSKVSAGNCEVVLNGNGNQIIEGKLNADYPDYLGRFGSITIDKDSGTVYLKDHIYINGDFKHLKGDVDFNTYDNHIYLLIGGSTIIGDFRIKNLDLFKTYGDSQFFYVGDSSEIEVNDLKVGALSSYSFTKINGGKIKVNGNLSCGAMYKAHGGNAEFVLSGDGDQLLSGASSPNWAVMPKITVDKESGTLNIRNRIDMSQPFTHISGNIYGEDNSSLYLSNNGNDTIGTSGDTTNFFTLLYANSISTANENDVFNGPVTVRNVYKAYDDYVNLNLNGNWLTLENPNAAAFQGHIVTSNTPNFKEGIKWRIGEADSASYYDFGFKYPVSNDWINQSVTVKKSGVGESGYLNISTYGTTPTDSINNQPLPNVVDTLIAEDTTNVSPHNYMVDRFWKVETEGFVADPVVDIVLRSSDVVQEKVGGFNNIGSSTTLIAQRWNSNGWDIADDSVSMETYDRYKIHDTKRFGIYAMVHENYPLKKSYTPSLFLTDYPDMCFALGDIECENLYVEETIGSTIVSVPIYINGTEDVPSGYMLCINHDADLNPTADPIEGLVLDEDYTILSSTTESELCILFLESYSVSSVTDINVKFEVNYENLNAFSALNLNPYSISNPCLMECEDCILEEVDLYQRGLFISIDRANDGNGSISDLGGTVSYKLSEVFQTEEIENLSLKIENADGQMVEKNINNQILLSSDWSFTHDFWGSYSEDPNIESYKYELKAQSSSGLNYYSKGVIPNVLGLRSIIIARGLRNNNPFADIQCNNELNEWDVVINEYNSYTLGNIDLKILNNDIELSNLNSIVSNMASHTLYFNPPFNFDHTKIGHFIIDGKVVNSNDDEYIIKYDYILECGSE